MTSTLKISYSYLRPFYERSSCHTSVIEELPNDYLKATYSRCRAITRQYAKTFYLAIRFLPNNKQRGIFAIYGLCRYLDNLVDEGHDLANPDKVISGKEINAKLDLVIKELEDIYSGKKTKNSILAAFADVIKEYNIPIKYPLLLIEGIRQDIIKTRYKTFEEVYDYSYKVASVVGLMTSEIFGYTDNKAVDYAIDLGIAMQLTNILRDIDEDLERDRIYLPKTELDAFNITEQQLFERSFDSKFEAFMKFQIDRARSYYEQAEKGIALLSKDSQLPVYLAHRNYSRILNKIEKNRYNVFGKRVYLSQTEKLMVLPSVLLKIRKAT